MRHIFCTLQLLACSFCMRQSDRPMFWRLAVSWTFICRVAWGMLVNWHPISTICYPSLGKSGPVTINSLCVSSNYWQLCALPLPQLYYILVYIYRECKYHSRYARPFALWERADIEGSVQIWNTNARWVFLYLYRTQTHRIWLAKYHTTQTLSVYTHSNSNSPLIMFC